jgi:hypothetical protein
MAKRNRRAVARICRDPRIADNIALHAACEESDQVAPLFALDRAILSHPDNGSAGMVFPLAALWDRNPRTAGGHDAVSTRRPRSASRPTRGLNGAPQTSLKRFTGNLSTPSTVDHRERRALALAARRAASEKGGYR